MKMPICWKCYCIQTRDEKHGEITAKIPVGCNKLSHQQWVAWVRQHDDGRWGKWLSYVEERYGFLEA